MLSPVLLSELDHVGRRLFGWHAMLEAVEDLERWVRAGRAELPLVTADVLRRARALRTEYADLALDLADAVTVVVAADYDTDAVLTLDRRDFGAVRPLSRHDAFKVLPDDLD